MHVHLVCAPEMPHDVVAWADHRTGRVYVDPSLLNNGELTAEGRRRVEQLLADQVPPQHTK